MVQSHSEPCRILLSSVKRNLLLGRICLFCILLTVVHMVLDASQGLYESVAFDFLLGLVMGFAYMLNTWLYHRTAKVFVLFTLNILFIFSSSVLPKGIGTYLYYFPLIVASSAFFDSDEKYLRLFFIAMPLALLGFLLLYNFDVLSGIEFESPMNERAFFAVNAFSSAAITIICVNFMQTLNVSSELELIQLAEEVKGKNVHLEKTNAELDRFLYSTSHDLRSPLSSIKGLVNIARMETVDAKLQGYFGMMIDRVDKLDFFIKDIIDYSKNARTEIHTEPVDFNMLLAEVTDNLKYIEGAESIQFKNNVLLGHSVNADKNRLSVILNNLMANAIKYHDPSKKEQWIDVEVSNSNGTIKVQVSDNGMGIDLEHHQKIFDMFYRGTFQSKGSGLGLYIVKETIVKMNGTIEVKSAPGEGSVFFITLPVS
jgi:signal transduction histidine kinase